MPHGTPADERLGKLRNIDRRHHARVNTGLFQRVLQNDGVHHGRQHADIIGRRPVHIARRFRNAAKDIAAANDDSDLDAELVDRLQLLGDRLSNLVSMP